MISSSVRERLGGSGDGRTAKPRRRAGGATTHPAPEAPAGVSANPHGAPPLRAGFDRARQLDRIRAGERVLMHRRRADFGRCDRHPAQRRHKGPITAFSRRVCVLVDMRLGRRTPMATSSHGLGRSAGRCLSQCADDPRCGSPRALHGMPVLDALRAQGGEIWRNLR